MDTQPQDHISNPVKVLDLIKKMQQQAKEQEEPVLTEQEAESIVEQMSEKKAEPRMFRAVEEMKGWVPRGEGGSGTQKHAEIESRSRSEPPPSDNQSVMSADDQNPEEEMQATPVELDDEDPVAVSGSSVEGPEEDVLIDSINEFILSQIASSIDPIAASVEITGSELIALRKLVESLRSEVGSLRQDVKKMKDQGPTTTLTAGQIPAPKINLPVAKPSHRRTPSVVELGKEQPQTQVVAEILSQHKTYPKFQPVRKKVLTELATRLGFVLGSRDVPPSAWNVDGILECMTAQTK